MNKLSTTSLATMESTLVANSSQNAILQPALNLTQSIGFKALRKMVNQWTQDQVILTLPDDTRHHWGNSLAQRQHHLRVHNSALFSKLVWRADLGLAESYIDGDWDVDDLTDFISAFIRNETDQQSTLGRALTRLIDWVRHRKQANTLEGSRKNISAHYDLGNAFYEQWLDTSMQYSSAVYPHPNATLEQAQAHKAQRILDRLDLKPGQKVLEIGSGWGELTVRMARDYGAHVTTVTLSQQQHDFTAQRIREEGLQDLAQVLLMDYRHVQGTFDKVVSIEMIEAVGYENLGTYFKTIEKRLAPKGWAVLQAITMPEAKYAQYLRTPDFIQIHIFPGGHCPSVTAINQAMTQNTQLQLQSLDNIGPHYATTLKHWRQRFHDKWQSIEPLGFDQRFRRLWDYYLCYCEAGFETRRLGTHQFVITRMDNEEMPR